MLGKLEHTGRNGEVMLGGGHPSQSLTLANGIRLVDATQFGQIRFVIEQVEL